MTTKRRIGLRDVARSIKRAMPPGVRRGLRRAQRGAWYLPRQWLGTITSVNTDEPVVALTFDDGPHPAQTPQFLELLEAYGARGTFFLLGQSAERYPELVKRIVDGGHAVGNHSWDHRSFPAIQARERRQQIRECARVLASATSAKIFRPPYGNQTLLSRLDPLWLGWDVVTWNICGNDWRGETGDEIAARIISALRPGSIVLLHDRLFQYEDARYTSREATLQAVRQVLEAGAGRYRFVTVPELLSYGRAQRELWVQPGQADYLAILKSGEI
jgi:peptidoglycan-N-acetylglucosamine deacetylase